MSLEPCMASAMLVVLASEAYAATDYVRLESLCNRIGQSRATACRSLVQPGDHAFRDLAVRRAWPCYVLMIDSSAQESISLSIGRRIGQRSVPFSFSFSKIDAPEFGIVLIVWAVGSCCFDTRFSTVLQGYRQRRTAPAYPCASFYLGLVSRTQILAFMQLQRGLPKRQP
jgi:hypothetical protein